MTTNLNYAETKSYTPDLHLVDSSSQINLTALSNSINNTKDKLNILPVNVIDKKELAEEHTSEPIKNMEDIKTIINYLLSTHQYRNCMLFIVGIHTGLRISDIRELKFNDFINSDCTFKDEIVVFEKKTRNTRKSKSNRHIPIHNDVKKIIALYLNNTQNVTLNDYMFTSESNNGSKANKPMSRQAIDNMLKDVIIDKLHINIHCSTHMLRKTFSYHTIMQAKDKSRAIQQLQLLLGHSSQLCTLRYAGITDDELAQTYKDLYFNLDDIL
jgi:Site-specific recombinase XerD